jgi:urease accessory protein
LTVTRASAAAARVLVPLLACLPAWAHVPQGASAAGFLPGLLHPLLGPDHLLAMVAVGMWGAVLGRPLLLALPVVFPVLMLGGATLGILGVGVPKIEVGIALSVVVLGAAIALAWRAPVWLALVVVGAFGAVRVAVAGAELPASANPAEFAAGFIVATGLLHLAGIAIGSLWSQPAGRMAVRLAGAAIGLAGLWFLVAAVTAG